MLCFLHQRIKPLDVPIQKGGGLVSYLLLQLQKLVVNLVQVPPTLTPQTWTAGYIPNITWVECGHKALLFYLCFPFFPLALFWKQLDDSSFVFKTATLRPEPENQDKACGVCLLNVDSRSKAYNRSEDSLKLSYGGRQYHATCANLWVNMVDSLLPALPLEALLW